MKKRVMIVDDDVSIRASLKRVLEQAGYAVVLATGCQEAAESPEPGHSDVLILDLNLPVQNAWYVFGRVNARFPSVPIIIITAFLDQHQAVNSVGAAAFLEKPLDVPFLLQTIERVCTRSPRDRLSKLGGLESPGWATAGNVPTPWHHPSPDGTRCLPPSI